MSVEREKVQFMMARNAGKTAQALKDMIEKLGPKFDIVIYPTLDLKDLEAQLKAEQDLADELAEVLIIHSEFYDLKTGQRMTEELCRELSDRAKSRAMKVIQKHKARRDK